MELGIFAIEFIDDIFRGIGSNAVIAAVVILDFVIDGLRIYLPIDLLLSIGKTAQRRTYWRHVGKRLGADGLDTVGPGA